VTTNTGRGGFGRPTLLTPNPDGIPDELKRLPQWVTFATKPKANGKLDKIPYTPGTQTPASTTAPGSWMSFNWTWDAYHPEAWAGIGFVFAPGDPYVGVDLDGCRDPETGAIEAWAQAIIDTLDTYTEPSVTGTGVHLIAKGTLPPTGRKKGQVEMYSESRFFATTGQPFPGRTEIRNCNGVLTELHESIFGKATSKEATPHPGPGLSLDDHEVLSRARAAANGVLFCALYDDGDLTAPKEGDGSQNSADLALCNLLRFWTGADPHQMDRLFRQSALMRPKWDTKRGETTYGQRTITKALTGATYDPGPAVTYIRHADPLDEEFVVGDEAGQDDSHAAFIDADGFDRCDTAAGLREIINTQVRRMNELADELAELRAVNKAMLAMLRSEAKPAAKVAAIELSIEAHTSRPEDFTSLTGVAGRINQSDDSVSETCRAYRAEAADDPAPFRVAYEARMVNPWTGEVSGEPHIYTKITPTHDRLSDTLAAIAAAIPDELRKKPRTDRGTKAAPATIPDELIPPCPEDPDAETNQRPEIVQVARCDDCGATLAAMTSDGTVLIPTTENIGSGKPDSHQQGCGLSYLYTDKSGRGTEASQSRHAWVQECIERDRVRRQISRAQLQDGAL
jgi:putative DNA primase/helicase